MATPGGFFRGHGNKFKMRMKGDEADEFRSGIAAGSCDGDANFSHGNLRFIAADIKKGKAEEPSLFHDSGSGV